MKNGLERMYARLDAWGEKLDQKQIRIPMDLTTGIVFFVLSVVVLLLMPSQVQISEKDIINGRAFPTLVCFVMMACSLALIVIEIMKIAAHKPLKWKVINMKTEGKTLILFGIIFVSYLLARLTNLFAIGAVFACIGFLLYFRTKKPRDYAIAIAISLTIWALFRFVLGVEF